MCIYSFCFLNSEEEAQKKSKCYIKTGLSWSASLVHYKPPSMENKKGGVDRQGFSLALTLSLSLSLLFSLSIRLGLADSWNNVLMHKAAVTLVVQT